MDTNTTIRKNITLTESSYNRFCEYAKRNGITFSEFLRQAATYYIEKTEENSLMTYIINNSEYVEQKEQKEIETLGIDFEDLTRKEISLNELLQS